MSNEDWITNIVDAAGEAASLHGSEAVRFVFAKYSAVSIEDLQERYYPAVWGELLLMTHDD